MSANGLRDRLRSAADDWMAEAGFQWSARRKGWVRTLPDGNDFIGWDVVDRSPAFVLFQPYCSSRIEPYASTSERGLTLDPTDPTPLYVTKADYLLGRADEGEQVRSDEHAAEVAAAFVKGLCPKMVAHLDAHHDLPRLAEAMAENGKPRRRGGLFAFLRAPQPSFPFDATPEPRHTAVTVVLLRATFPDRVDAYLEEAAGRLTEFEQRRLKDQLGRIDRISKRLKRG